MSTFAQRGAIVVIILFTLLIAAACTNQSSLSRPTNTDTADAAEELAAIFEEEQFDEAVRTFRSMVANAAQYRFDEDALTKHWQKIHRANKYDASVEFGMLFVEIFPRSFDAYDAIGWSLISAGKLAEAEPLFQRALAINPTYSSSLRGLGRIYIVNNYTKKEYMIAMRDGVKLSTTVYSPKDTSVEYPFVMKRTPYSSSPYGEDTFPSSLGPSTHFARDGFHFVRQDVRGKYMSEGEFLDMRPLELGEGPNYTDEATDTYDTIEWLVANVENNNGKVGMWGVSYPGGYASMGVVSRHPALVVSSPQAPTTDWWMGDDFHRHGAFTYMLAISFFPSFGAPRPEPTTERSESLIERPLLDAYTALLEAGSPVEIDKKYFQGRVRMWNDFIAHPNYDEFWQNRNILPHLTDISAAMMTVGGWFDAEDPYGPLETYEAVEKANPDAENMLVIGPWYHGGWNWGRSNVLGDIDFGSGDAGAYYREHVEFPFFRYHLKGGEKPDLPDALIYATGSNEWHRFDEWPAANITPATLYLHENGALAWDAPTASGNGNYDEYLSDPNRPVPFSEKPINGWNYGFMHADQRFAATRPDVLVYETAPLEEETTLAGPIVADLLVSTTGSDADFIVKIIDVYPDDYDGESPENEDLPMAGYQMLVRWEIMPARFRKSFEQPKAMAPGEVTRVRFEIEDVLHTFKPGHKIMVQIHSTWFPIFMRNPQTFVDNPYTAQPGDYRKATHRIYRSSSSASRIEVGILPK